VPRRKTLSTIAFYRHSTWISCSACNSEKGKARKFMKNSIRDSSESGWKQRSASRSMLPRNRRRLDSEFNRAPRQKRASLGRTRMDGSLKRTKAQKLCQKLVKTNRPVARRRRRPYRTPGAKGVRHRAAPKAKVRCLVQARYLAGFANSGWARREEVTTKARLSRFFMGFPALGSGTGCLGLLVPDLAGRGLVWFCVEL
jgi:hypothetical protein